MKKRIMAIVAGAAALFLFSCATTSTGGPLRDTIEQVADRLATDIPAGTSVAVVSFESESESLSRFIIDSLVGALADRGVHVMTRQSVELELVRQEMNFGLTGEVSDATAQSIGQMIGVEIVVTGHLRDIGVTHHFLANAIEVETARHVSVPRFDVRNDRVLRGMIAALDGPPTQDAGTGAQAVPTTVVQNTVEGVAVFAAGEINRVIPRASRVAIFNHATADESMANDIIDIMVVTLIGNGHSIAPASFHSHVEEFVMDNEIVHIGVARAENVVVIVDLTGTGSMRHLRIQAVDVLTGRLFMQSAPLDTWRINLCGIIL